MPDLPEPSKPRKRQARRISPIDQMMQRERGRMEIEMRRNAVLEYVANQLAELNDLLRDAGLRPAPPAYQPQQFSPVPPPQTTPAAPQPPVARPCAWCGRPGSPVNVGNGTIQDLCPSHKSYVLGQQNGPVEKGVGPTYKAAAAQGFSVDSTDARPQAPVLNNGKVLMQPLPQDERQAQQHAQQHIAEANGVSVGEAFEELGDE